jgi:glycosyltransferase involved in cell wall biosynthesis
LRIVLIGTFATRADEGLRSISSRILKELQKEHEVIAFNTWESLGWGSVQTVKRFKPNILHYLTGPTVRSFVVLRVYKLLLGDIICIASSIRPFFSSKSRWAVSFLKPDLVLTQATRWETFFRSKGIKTIPLMNGVDLARFQPVDRPQTSKELRRKYGIPIDKFVVLHVGHIKENRNVEVLAGLQGFSDVQCVVVGSTSTEVNRSLKDRLSSAGCIVIDEFVENIAELYQLSDCYVFCVRDVAANDYPAYYQQVGVIDTPLSVLEAMASNLPVVTTRIGSLPRLFEERDGFHFYDGSLENLLQKIGTVRKNPAAKTREMVAPYDWTRIIAQLEEIYKKCHQLSGVQE